LFLARLLVRVLVYLLARPPWLLSLHNDECWINSLHNWPLKHGRIQFARRTSSCFQRPRASMTRFSYVDGAIRAPSCSCACVCMYWASDYPHVSSTQASVHRAKRRLAISTLYLGTGSHEQTLVRFVLGASLLRGLAHLPSIAGQCARCETARTGPESSRTIRARLSARYPWTTHTSVLGRSAAASSIRVLKSWRCAASHTRTHKRTWHGLRV